MRYAILPAVLVAVAYALYVWACHTADTIEIWNDEMYS
jgi:hypothetical protein